MRARRSNSRSIPTSSKRFRPPSLPRRILETSPAMPRQDASHHTEATHPAHFVTTRWSVVLAARANDGSPEALAWLCERYWLPIYALIRIRGHPPEAAKDLV